MKGPLLDRAIPEKGDADAVVPPQPGGERGTHRDRYRGGNDRDGPEEANLGRDQMHRSTTAARASGPLAVQLREHRLEIAPLGQVMTVRAVTAEDVVVPSQGGAHPSRHRFLPGVEMGGAPDLPLHE